ncbi:MAG TPA: preprotein translocase subunit YajC [Syntrophomonadaceae bacterium]|nr:preprotein translocase subunit YajC [Syntrophomonadaceae bacterium]
MNQSWLTIIIYFGVFFLIFWLFIIKPRRTQEKKHTQMVDSLRKGEKVVTIGGINGEIARVKDETVMLKVAENLEMEILTKAIAYKVDED